MRFFRLPPGLASVVTAFLLSGCVSGLPPLTAPHADRSHELVDTPFYPQTEFHCGPAALATVLTQSGVEASAESLGSDVFIPGLKGSLREELLAVARQHGRIPVLLEEDPQALVDTVAAGKPVLVLQNLGSPAAPFWHYAVLIGFLPQSNEFLLRSGTVRRQKMSLRRFLYSWDWGGRWAVALLAPGESLNSLSQPRYLSALGAVEQTGTIEFALAAFRGASELFPDSPITWAGYGHAAWRSGDLDTARSAFEKMLALNPSSVTAHNNLANVYLHADCPRAARHHAERAVDLLQPDSRFTETVRSTLQEITLETRNMRGPCEFGETGITLQGSG